VPPITTDKDKVRLKVGDTDATAQLLSDDEIAALLEMHGSVARTAPAAALAIAAKFARDYTFEWRSGTNTGGKFNRAERVAHYQALARELRAEQGISTQATTRVDGHSDDVDYQEVSTSSKGRVRAGYFDPDLPR